MVAGALTCRRARAQVCIIGAGKMSRLLVKHLQSKGCERVTVLNRSLPRAEALAEEFPEVQFDIRLMPELLECVAASDVIFAASGSEELLVQKEDLMGAPVGVPVGWPSFWLTKYGSWGVFI